MRRDFNDSERFAIAQRVEEIQKQANSANMRKGRAMTADFEKRNEIKDMILDGVPQRKIADELGVGRPTVQKAVKAIKDGNDLYFDERTTKVNFEKNNHSCPGSTEGRANWSQDKAGEAVGVSGTAYRNMKKTQSLGSSELIEARDEDKVSRAVAADIAELSKAEQANVNFDDKASIKEHKPKVRLSSRLARTLAKRLEAERRSPMLS
ncbi:hypothetical protein JCM19241_5959 [Vibrio ishigakensis]|uniref:Uncharacterized protein n=1 Tax=Vibrio ishigakensis TaxID=1481914 RepID=A0A0B8QQ13_9VIBR|nr:hypothetical protein JCM19241_5959 [Vibrio ishigakensis]